MSLIVDQTKLSPRLITLADLMARPQEEVDFLVEGLLVKAGLGLLAGKPKAGKSTLARVLALAVARGEPFMGLPTEQGTVLYYGLEEKDLEGKRHFEDMGAKGTEPIIISTQRLPGNDGKALAEDMRRHNPVLVIVDPLFRAVKVREANSYSEVSNALEPYLFLARESKAHILFVHHLGKGDRRGADAILGSTAIRGAFDVNILLNKTEHHRTILSECRYGTDLEEAVLVFDPDTRVVSLGEKREAADADRIGNEIILLLEKACSGLNQKEIDSKINARTEWKRVALRKLLESNKIRRTGRGTRGDPFIYFNSCSDVPAPSGDQGNKNLQDAGGPNAMRT